MAFSALVAVENATFRFDRLYTYLVPGEINAKNGCRVTVPFGAGNMTRFGIILEMHETEQTDKLKTIFTLVDEEPLLNEEMTRLVRYLHDTVFCGYYDAVRTVLPPGIGVRLRYTYELSPIPAVKKASEGMTNILRGEHDEDEKRILEYLTSRKKPVREATLCSALGISPEALSLRELCIREEVVKSQEVIRRISDEKQVLVRLGDGIESPGDIGVKLTPKQKVVVNLLAQTGQASVKEICYFAAVGKTVLDKLASNGVVHYFTREIYRSPYSESVTQEKEEDLTLSEEQETACTTLECMINTRTARTALLYGVTGSGKTEVFLRAIRRVIDSGRGVIVMVPEISLTPQTIERFRRAFGNNVAVLHSALSMGERMDEWKRIRAGAAKIVVGTRSAVFAPLQDIGMIVMDEEQETSYKSEKSPRYHARDIARMRVKYHGAVLLLASATPCVESFFRAKEGKYELLTLKERFGTAKLPDVTILDLSTQSLDARSDCISDELIAQLQHNLEAGEQSILLLNRRGYQTLVKCSVCSAVASCPNCSVALTYHSANRHLMCHYCGYSAPADGLCNSCGSKLRRFSGAGTQKVEEELHSLFPQARVLRMDMDTTMARFSHERCFSDFSDGKYDILIGTQMVAKGLNFPNVTLVGVLSADGSLYAQDYRSYERAFSLLTQVVGRSGRAIKSGRAYIQTFTPENAVLQLAACQDYESFYDEEIESRKIHLYPPFCDMAGIGFYGIDNCEVRTAAELFLHKLTDLAKEKYADLPLRILGPCEGAISKIAGKYRWHMAVKCAYNARTREFLRLILEWYYMHKQSKNVSVFIDPHYESAI